MLAISKGSASPAARPPRAAPRRARACSAPEQATACHASNLQGKRLASGAPSTRTSTPCPRVFCAKTGNSVSCWQSPREAPRQQRAQHARLHAVPARVLHARTGNSKSYYCSYGRGSALPAARPARAARRCARACSARQNRQQRVMLAISKENASPALRPARAAPRRARACSAPKQATACHAGNLQGKRLASSAPSTRGSTPCPRVFCTRRNRPKQRVTQVYLQQVPQSAIPTPRSRHCETHTATTGPQQ